MRGSAALLVLCAAGALAAPGGDGTLTRREQAFRSDAGKAAEALDAFEAGISRYRDEPDLAAAKTARQAELKKLDFLSFLLKEHARLYHIELETLEIRYAAEHINNGLKGRPDPAAFSDEERTSYLFDEESRAVAERLRQARRLDALEFDKESRLRRGKRRLMGGAAAAALLALGLAALLRKEKARPQAARPPSPLRRPRGSGRLE